MEQNTDRMWWTIGIVVIGGLLIGAAVVLLGDQSSGLLGTVADKMHALFDQYTPVLKQSTPVNTISQ